MPTKTFRYAAIALRILEKILGSKFTVTGIEKLPKHPVLFVCNHFTRSETFFIPYLIYKYCGRQVRCLADSSLYHGQLGKFLESVGTISTKNPNRDNIILKDLISGSYDWMIYPEGSMIKSKETKHGENFVNYTPYRVGPIRTGAAVLGLKSELYRNEIISAADKNQEEILKDLENTFDLSYHDYFKEIHTHIVPVNITYYPLRPGINNIQRFASKLVKNLPQQISEELEIEGNLLLGAEIGVHFSDPINLGEYIKMTRDLVYQIPVIKNETKSNIIIRYFKHRLTNEFMEIVYNDLEVNFDHVFSATICNIQESEIEIDHLKRLIYLSASMIQKCGKYRIHHSIFEENLFKMFIDEDFKEFDSVFDLACKQNIIEKLSDDKIKINKSALLKNFDFHEIRLENSLHVIANEASMLQVAMNIIKRNVKIPDEELRRKVFTEIHAKDLEIYNSDYQIYFDEKFSKDKSVGKPFFIPSKSKAHSKIKRTGIVISHGYKSAPKEVEALAQFLNGFGFKVYATRLKGHGTAPINLKDTSWQDWYYSTQRGYAALRNICSKVVMIGFSTGGLLSLVASIRKKNNNHLAALITINAALKLRDMKVAIVPGINIWNEMLEKLHIDKGKLEYVDDKPENPDINYSRNYLKGVEQLENLMQFCEKNLEKVSTKSLIIQGNQDSVVDPISAKMIYEKINSKEKFLSELDFANHVIINGERKEEVFEVIKDFLRKINLL